MLYLYIINNGFIHSTSRNRAIHGDRVIIRLLPRSQWKSRNKALPSEETETKGKTVTDHIIMPTGTVVGILERADRLYVATFDVSSPLLHVILFFLVVVLL